MSPNSSDSNQDVPLAEMIKTLRSELQSAQSDASATDLRFKIEKVDLELKVAVTGKGTADAGVKFWVVNAGGKFEKAGETAHTFRLTLTPVWPATGSSLVSGESRKPIAEN